MEQVLLKELNAKDFEWILARGHYQEIEAGTILIEEGKMIDSLYILLDGTLTISISGDENNPLTRVFSAIEEKEPLLEISKLTSGAVLGDISLIKMCLATTTVTAAEKSSIVSIPLLELERRLADDVAFAARFYKAIAILLKDRLYNFITAKSQNKFKLKQSVKDILLFFGGFNDSDLDWIVANGKVKEIPANETLIAENSRVNNLYILLDGGISLVKNDGNHNPLARIFAKIEDTKTTGIEISHLSKGGIVGESQFVGDELPFLTAITTQYSRVLEISSQKLTVKLEQDWGFAARFYQNLAILFSDRFQALLMRLGYSSSIYAAGRSLADDVNYDLELSSLGLEQISLAGEKFNWMLKRLKNSVLL